VTALRRLGRALRNAPATTPLRVKLVTTLLTLVALALTVAGIAGTTALRTYLLDRVDGNLAASARDLLEHGRSGPPRGGPPLSTSYYQQITNAAGQPLVVPYLAVPPASSGSQTPPSLPELTAARVADLDGRPFTAAALGAGHRWRVLVTALPEDAGAITVATSLDDVDSTVGRLQRINLVVSLLVLAGLALLGYLVVLRSLRPLVQVETTAGAIAAGDLTRRVPNADARTEVGRLATALNAMLTRIESAFSAQRASEARARASEERMRRFVADASHELRTPLTSIRGFAELHRQGAVPDSAALSQVMRRIEDEAARMGLLVEDLLLLARLDQQRPLERRPVDLLALAADAVQDARAISPNHPARLEVAADETAAAPPVVLGDEARLRQVVANLMSNAVTHTPPGTVVTVAVATEGEEAVLSVADTGPGLAPDDAARAFERFYRADASRTRAHGGSGLGLSIVAALVAAHGGTVGLDTDPGTGARFAVRLPLYRAGPSAATALDRTVVDGQPAGAALGGT
jgi:two-component system OmpR family sensor kinase